MVWVQAASLSAGCVVALFVKTALYGALRAPIVICYMLIFVAMLFDCIRSYSS